MPSIQEAALAAATCDARTGEKAGDYGFTPLWCHQTRGLRSYTDRSGLVRRFCANHEAVVRRRYPEAPVVEVAVFDAPPAALGRFPVPRLTAREEREEMLADHDLMADEMHGRSW